MGDGQGNDPLAGTANTTAVATSKPKPESTFWHCVFLACYLTQSPHSSSNNILQITAQHESNSHFVIGGDTSLCY